MIVSNKIIIYNGFNILFKQITKKYLCYLVCVYMYIDRQARILVQTLVNLLGCDGDKIQADIGCNTFLDRF